MPPKKLFSFLVICLISLSFFSCSKEKGPRIASTLEGVDYEGNTLVEVTFKDESRMYFKLNDNATAEVVRGGLFISDNTDWILWIYRGDIVIPEHFTHDKTTYKVTGIGEYAFYSNTESLIASVTLPTTIDTIREGAFHSCEHLTSIKIPQSVKYIGVRSFSGCRHLTSFEIPASVQCLGMNVFSGCSSLKTLTCHAVIPPRSIIEFFYVDAYILLSEYIEKIYVPTESVNLYKESPDWRYYKDIIVGF